MAKAIASGRCIFMLCLSKVKRNKSRLGWNQTCQRIGAGFALYVRPSSSRGRAIWSDRESYSPFLLVLPQLSPDQPGGLPGNRKDRAGFSPAG